MAGCGSSNPSSSKGSKFIAPENMPDICQDLDFNRDEEFRDVCGVKTRDYLAYRNIPEHRNLLLPKGGKIIKKGRSLELRLPNTLPVAMPAGMTGKIIFDEKLRRTFIKSKMDYCEFFPENSPHTVKIIKLEIPQDTGGEIAICYTVESRQTSAQRKSGYASRLEPLGCEDFQRLKNKSLARENEPSEGNTDSTGE